MRSGQATPPKQRHPSRPAQESDHFNTCPTRREASIAMPPEQRLQTTTSARTSPLLHLPDATRSEQSHATGAATPDHDQRKDQPAPTPARRDAKRAKPCHRSSSSRPRPAQGSARFYAGRTRCEASKAMHPQQQLRTTTSARIRPLLRRPNAMRSEQSHATEATAPFSKGGAPTGAGLWRAKGPGPTVLYRLRGTKLWGFSRPAGGKSGGAGL